MSRLKAMVLKVATHTVRQGVISAVLAALVGCFAGRISDSASSDAGADSGSADTLAPESDANTQAPLPPVPAATPCTPAASPVTGAAIAAVATSGDASRLLSPVPGATFATGGCDPAGAVPVMIDPCTVFQTILGFGGSLTDSAARNISTYDHVSSPNAITQLFSPKTGIGLNLVHVDVGAGEFSSNGDLSYDGKGDHLPPDPNLTNFSMGGAEDHYTFSVLSSMRSANPNLLLIAAPWTGPSWMKDTNTCSGGTLAPQYLGTMARYMLMFIQAYQAAGNTIYAIAPQNDPDVSGNANGESFPSSLLPAAQEANFIVDYLGPLLRTNEPNVKIFSYEGGWSGIAHPLAVLANSTARSYIAGTAFHCDTGNPNAQDQVASAFPAGEISLTRCGRTQATSFAEDLEWYGANMLVGALQHGASSLIMYNLALDQSNGRTNGGCKNCRPVLSLYIDTADEKQCSISAHNVEYYIIGHLSKYVMRGAHRIASSAAAVGIFQVAFQNPNGSFVLFVLNTNDTATQLSLHLGNATAQVVVLPHAATTLTWPRGT